MCRLSFLAILMVFAGCMSDSDSSAITIFSENFDFAADLHGWQHGFSEYPPKDSTAYELKYAYVVEPTGTNSIMLSGNNRSTNLFMYLKRRLLETAHRADAGIVDPDIDATVAKRRGLGG